MGNKKLKLYNEKRRSWMQYSGVNKYAKAKILTFPCSTHIQKFEETSAKPIQALHKSGDSSWDADR